MGQVGAWGPETPALSKDTPSLLRLGFREFEGRVPTLPCL